MRARRTITVVGCHAGGEVGNVVVGGVLPPVGGTVFEQMQTLRADDSLRRLLLREPRGSVAVHANLVVPPTRADCDAGFIVMEPTEYPAMSGSNTICVTTVLLETGMLELREPVTTLRLEAPAGVVEVAATCRDGRVESVELTNVPAFAEHLDASLEVEGSARSPSTSRTAACGTRSPTPPRSASQSSRTRHATFPPWASASAGRRASSCRASIPRTPRSPASASSRSRSHGRASEQSRATRSSSRRDGSTVRQPGRVCRRAWPCCTRAGRWHVGDAMTHASPIGSTFDGRIVGETTVGDRPAIVPAIRGSAWITGITQVFVDPDDPFPEGYLLSDTWPGDDVQ